MEPSVTGDAVSPADVERLVGELRPIDIEEVGSAEWKAQREVLERLNVQAHHNVASKRDEFVYEALHSLEKLGVVVHELLVNSVWKERVYPLLRTDLDRSPSGGYMYLHYEAVLTNLLEVCLFNEDAPESLGDLTLELCDYCYRQVLYLNALPESHHLIPKTDKDALLAMTDEEHHQRTQQEMRFKVAMNGLSLLWMIVDKLPKLHLSVMNNLLLKNDIILQLVFLIANPPWFRRGEGKFQKYREGQWQTIPNSELLLLCQPEAHVWLCLHVLLCEPTCRSKYTYDSYRQEEILKLRRFVTERLVDQLPNLTDLQRALDELQIMAPPHSSDERFKSAVVVEPTPQLYLSILRDREGHSRNWPRIAAEQAQRLFSPQSVQEDVDRLSKLIDAMGLENGP
eukprot:RCo033149